MLGTSPHFPGFPVRGNAHVLGEKSLNQESRREEASRLPHRLPAAGLYHKPCTMPSLLKTQTELKHFCSLKNPTESGAGDGDPQIPEQSAYAQTGRKTKELSEALTHPSPRGNEAAQLFTDMPVTVMS